MTFCNHVYEWLHSSYTFELFCHQFHFLCCFATVGVTVKVCDPTYIMFHITNKKNWCSSRKCIASCWLIFLFSFFQWLSVFLPRGSKLSAAVSMLHCWDKLFVVSVALRKYEKHAGLFFWYSVFFPCVLPQIPLISCVTFMCQSVKMIVEPCPTQWTSTTYCTVASLTFSLGAFLYKDKRHETHMWMSSIPFTEVNIHTHCFLCFHVQMGSDSRLYFISCDKWQNILCFYTKLTDFLLNLLSLVFLKYQYQSKDCTHFPDLKVVKQLSWSCHIHTVLLVRISQLNVHSCHIYDLSLSVQ